eukprot:7791594-Alexandrium_andersonii.AAC.1
MHSPSPVISADGAACVVRVRQQQLERTAASARWVCAFARQNRSSMTSTTSPVARRASGAAQAAQLLQRQSSQHAVC